MMQALLRWSLGLRAVIAAGGWAIMLFLYLPIVMLVLYSFSEPRNFLFPIESWSLRWYALLWSDSELLHSIRNSLIVAAGVVPLTLLLGIPAAFVVARLDLPGVRLFERAVLLPLMIPGLVTGLALLLILRGWDFQLSLVTVIIGHSVAWLPVVVTQVSAKLRRLDRSFEEASLDLGADRFETFRWVVLPNIASAIFGSALLVFTLSFDEVAITFLLTGSKNTLPMQIWSMLRQGVTPEICAIATITVALSTLLVVTGLRLAGPRS
ncbi:ABC transporter permease [Hypericibacter sp.]|uniref:ABC transporter permease n=1 Tax=Hypericibacter sp. TaxID=2705401 RepID=UPI003D6D4A9E